jgi:hypothetical protein
MQSTSARYIHQKEKQKRAGDGDQVTDVGDKGDEQHPSKGIRVVVSKKRAFLVMPVEKTVTTSPTYLDAQIERLEKHLATNPESFEVIKGFLDDMKRRRDARDKHS